MTSFRRSDAPPSLEAANQAQIDDLVRRNRTLEHTNKKLSEQVSVEVDRSKEAVLEIQKQWHEHESHWREETEDLLACYRYVQLRTVSELESERLNVLNEQKALRKEKLLRLQRDFRITMFHASERELEERIVELEDENERMIEERKELAVELKKRFAQLIAQLRLKDVEIADLNSERDVADKDVGKVREEHAHLQASLASTLSKLERITLQLEGAQSSRSELESINDELKRKNHDLQRQLDKWQRLENKGEAELDTLRKRKIELEVEVKELRDRLDEAGDENTKALEKERKRVERMKETTLEWQQTAESYQTELEETKTKLNSLHKELSQLRSQISTKPPPQPPAKPTPSRSKKKPTPVTVTDSEVEIDAEAEGAEHNAPKKRGRRKKGSSNASENEIDQIREASAPPPPAAAKKAAKKSRRMSPVVEEDEEGGSEAEDPPMKTNAKGKGKEKGKGQDKEPAKLKPKANTKPVEVSNTEAPPPKAPTQRKRKASADPDNERGSEKPGKKAKTTSRAGAGSTRGGDHDRATEDQNRENIGVDPVQKPKRRKINLFAGAGSQSSQLGGFEFLGSNGLGGGLNIPTELSPVTDGPIPNRAISSSVMSSLGGLIKNRMGGVR
ncbi:hypothetical protein P691DRAFT_725087 [Macrolepiota fuliginosa MF-IS2]|uniref:Uncharacterized protein n=1 Tax=Macrolepiota fuliginosa MF-IS2 TaxID=1400762 RepID=A0A9P6C3N0_9AGAR|nr:hypothetical protein P691DRAFT_725087 [Macrolepiota fuliginosa MF-IS2]